jgi:hypothetical protein
MDLSFLRFSLPPGLILAVVLLGSLLAAIVPTCLYVYVEPRGRRQWAVAGDTPSTRRAPALLRFTAWLSFVVGQLGLPLLLVPATCAGLLYVQVRLGSLSPVGLGVTAALGIAALVQALLALRLVVVGVRLLARNAKECGRAAAVGRFYGTVHGLVLAGTMALGWAMRTMPGFVKPVLRHTLEWTALRPVLAFAVISLIQALLLARSGQIAQERSTGTK